MVKIQKSIFVLGFGCLLGLSVGPAFGAPEWNPVRGHGVEIGPQASRLIVGFKVTSDNAVTKTVQRRSQGQSVKITQAKTSEADVLSLAQRTGVAMAGSRQITPSMHVLFLPKTLYGADVNAVLAETAGGSRGAVSPTSTSAAIAHSRAQRSFIRTQLRAPASGQWYMNTPSPHGHGGGRCDHGFVGHRCGRLPGASPPGSTGIVIADVDTGVIDSIIPTCCAQALVAGCCLATISSARISIQPTAQRFRHVSDRK